MQLRELLNSINYLAVDGSTRVEITGVASDARRVAPGNLYVALQRENDDGHERIDLAVARGAAAVVCRRNGGMRGRAVRIEVASTQAALAEAAAAFHQAPVGSMRVAAVAGKNGAWKTSFLLKQILQRTGISIGLISSVRHEIGERRLPAGQTFESDFRGRNRMEACDAHRLLAEMTRADCTGCVVEAGAISIPALRSIDPDTFIFDSGDFTPREINEWRGGTGGKPCTGIINIDEESGGALACSSLFDVQITYGLAEAAEVRGRILRLRPSGTDLQIKAGGIEFDCSVPLVGRRHVYQLLAAVAAAISFGATSGRIARELEAVQTPPGSLERAQGARGFDVYIDEAGTAETLEATMRSLREISPGRILLAMGATERSTGRERFEMGRVAAKYAQHVILTSDNPGREGPAQICSALGQGIESLGRATCQFQPDRSQAIDELIGMAREGDLLLISGKGDRTWQVFANTVVPFSDRLVAEECLRKFRPGREYSNREPVARRDEGLASAVSAGSLLAGENPVPGMLRARVPELAPK